MKKVEPYVITELRVYDKKMKELREWFGIPDDEEIASVTDVGERIVVSTNKTILDKRNL